MKGSANTDMLKRTIWIAWERQRRTLELSRALEVQLFILGSRHTGIIRYLESAWRTIRLLHRYRPKQLLIQNPSIVLAFLATCLKVIFGYRLIVDRHTNFDNFHLFEADAKQRTLGMLRLRLIRRFFFLISDFTLKHSDLTIVTNEPLKGLVESKGGKAFVLPDKLPNNIESRQLTEGRTNIVTCVSTYAHDEPYLEVILAAKYINPQIKIYFTGNNSKIEMELVDTSSPNVVFTGFLSDDEYFDFLRRSDIIAVFTLLENCLVCGGYEAVAVGKPFLTSKTEALQNYFYKGTKHVDNLFPSIAEGIKEIYLDYDHYVDGIKQLRMEICAKWPLAFNQLKKELRL